jgi:transcriptional regulator of acetoin/glycerol metabolism
MESLVLCSDSDHLDIDSITHQDANRIGLTTGLPLATSASSGPAILRTYPILESVTRQAIENALHDARGNIPEAAARLGVGRSTLYRWLKAFVPLAPSDRR